MAAYRRQSDAPCTKRPTSSWLARACACLAVLGVLVSWCVPSQVDGVFPIPQLAAAGPWYAVPALAAVLLGAWSRRRVALALGALCLAVQLAVAVPFWVPDGLAADAAGGSAAAPAAEPASVRVMTLNAYFGQADARAVVDAVRDEGIEVLCLQETTAAFTEALEEAGLDGLLPYRTGSTVGNQVWSSLPLEDAVGDAVGYSGSAMPAATVELADGSRLRFVSVHTCSPSLGYEGLWHYSLAMLAKVGALDGGRGENAAYVLAGDFNASFSHASFRAVLDAGFVDGALQAGEGLHFTWPAGSALPPLVTLDHILLADGLTARDFSYVDVPGSDHRAVLATVAAG